MVLSVISTDALPLEFEMVVRGSLGMGKDIQCLLIL